MPFQNNLLTSMQIANPMKTSVKVLPPGQYGHVLHVGGHEFDEVNLDSEGDNTGEVSNVEISPGKEFGDDLIEVNDRMKEGEAGEVQMNEDQVKKDKAVVEIDNSSKLEPSKKLPTIKEELVVDDKKINFREEGR